MVVALDLKQLVELTMSNLCSQNVDHSTLQSEVAITQKHGFMFYKSEKYLASSCSSLSSSLDSLDSSSDSDSSSNMILPLSRANCVQEYLKASGKDFRNGNTPLQMSKLTSGNVTENKVFVSEVTNRELRKEKVEGEKLIQMPLSDESEMSYHHNTNGLEVTHNLVSTSKGTFVPNGAATEHELSNLEKHKNCNRHVDPSPNCLNSQWEEDSYYFEENETYKPLLFVMDKVKGNKKKNTLRKEIPKLNGTHKLLNGQVTQKEDTLLTIGGRTLTFKKN